ncbi:MAG: C4-dicarboxylate ABC transporter permease, partial [Synergistaceae bacterium]|nr:C4-dicarboxylate ABC transporter permease [Synergistaceae bacterium]
MTPENTPVQNIDSEAAALRSAEKVLEKVDAESRFRKFTGKWGLVITVIAVAMSLFHLYTSGFGTLMAMKQRSVHLAFLLLLTFLLYPGSGRAPRKRPSVIDFLWLALALSSSLYILFTFDAFSMRGTAIAMDYIMGTILVVCVLEATRRTVGKELMILSLIFLAYGYWGEYIPGDLGHTGFSFKRIIYQLFLSSEGIFGISLG